MNPIERRIQRRPDPAGADDPDHRRFAQIDVEPVERESDQTRRRLRADPVVEHLPPAGTGRTDRLDLCGVDILDVLGQELGEKSDGRKRQRQKARQGPEPDHGDEEDGDDDLLKRARDCDQGAADEIDRGWCNVARCAYPDRDGDQDPDHRCGQGHGEALD